MTRVFLDTHVVVWLFAGDSKRLSKAARVAIEENDLAISPAVKLELGYLHEIGRFRFSADTVVRDLAVRVGLQVDATPFEQVINHALEMTWTRDVFDRLIVAHAEVDAVQLVTKDGVIRKHYARAIW